MQTANILRIERNDAMWHGFGFDNGLFTDFVKGEPFNEVNFFNKLDGLLENRMFPDFIVVPDIIGGGVESLKYSVDFLPRLAKYPFPKYLVVQDGMEKEDVEPYLDAFNNDEQIEFDSIFVGGKPTFEGFGKKKSDTIEWKLQTMEMWNELAHEYGKKCHIGRVSSIRRLNFARSIGVDSMDTSIVNFSQKAFKRYEKASKQAVMCFA